MPLWIRRTIYFAFIVLFLVVAPMLALYSMGYRYHPGKRRLETTGLLVIDGTPTDAIVRINGSIRAQRLPAHIGGIGANTYTVRVEREGFHPIEERVTVTNGRASFLRDMLLIRDTAPLLLQSGDVTALSTSADQRWASFLRYTPSFTELWMLDLRTLESRIVLRTPQPAHPELPRAPLTTTWSPTGALVLVTTPTTALLINPADPQRVVTLHASLPAFPSIIQWELGDTLGILAVSNRTLYRIHRTTGRATALPVPAPTTPFGATRTTMYTVADATVHAWPLNGDAPQPIAALPPRTRITAITKATDRTVELHAEGPAQRITIDLRTGTSRTQPHLLSRLHPEHAGEIWWTNPFELWATHDPNPPALLARRETPIVDAIWHPSAPYVFFATGRDIAATRTSEPDRPITIPLAAFDVIHHITVQAHGTALLISGRRGTTAGLWILPLQ
ncbi:PEGA domain-containing protein [Candidatus Uhrbacteria bacterium]|nr:PEGA domain-containing protein [Candidatus Uhrbacteria bacterium]